MFKRLLVLSICMVAGACPARGATAPDLSARITIDGYAGDFTGAEAVFGQTGSGRPEEPADDSAWGSSYDVYQIHVSWDRRALYVAVDAILASNNVVLALDARPGVGFADMFGLNSWRRNIGFGNGFMPDVFLATWDFNPSARLLIDLGDGRVEDHSPGVVFTAVSSFENFATGRSMEARIPWSSVFGPFTHDTLVSENGQDVTIALLPEFAVLKFAAFMTAGWDGSGSPDTAPNNLTGCGFGYDRVIVDNFVLLPLDVDGDRFPDVGAEPHERRSFYDLSTPARRTSWGALKQRAR